MDSGNLAPSQARKLNDSIRLKLGYFYRLKERMEQAGYPRDDKLYRMVWNSHDALHRLTVETHYTACGTPTETPSPDITSPE